jgi:hypothetical protein
MRNLSRRLAIYARRPPGVTNEPGPGSESAGPL